MARGSLHREMRQWNLRTRLQTALRLSQRGLLRSREWGVHLHPRVAGHLLRQAVPRWVLRDGLSEPVHLRVWDAVRPGRRGVFLCPWIRRERMQPAVC